MMYPFTLIYIDKELCIEKDASDNRCDMVFNFRELYKVRANCINEVMLMATTVCTSNI